MELEVQSRGIGLAEESRTRAVAVLARSLASYHDHIARVVVRFFEDLGQLDRVETTCVVFVRLHRAASVVVEARDQEIELALARAVRLACTAVEHRLDRRRSAVGRTARPEERVVSAG